MISHILKQDHSGTVYLWMPSFWLPDSRYQNNSTIRLIDDYCLWLFWTKNWIGIRVTINWASTSYCNRYSQDLFNVQIHFLHVGFHLSLPLLPPLSFPPYYCFPISSHLFSMIASMKFSEVVLKSLALKMLDLSPLAMMASVCSSISSPMAIATEVTPIDFKRFASSFIFSTPRVTRPSVKTNKYFATLGRPSDCEWVNGIRIFYSHSTLNHLVHKPLFGSKP